MYLREMGGVELLSREGEIAIAKRIEAGKDVMINALTQSPIVAKKIFEWKDKLENGELLVRDIIDIDSTYEDFEGEQNDDGEKVKAKTKTKDDNKDSKSKDSKDSKDSEENKKSENDYLEEEDEFNVSLAAMEEEIKPKILASIQSLSLIHI